MIELRRIKESDLKDLYVWRNSKEVRDMMFNPKPIVWKEHLEFWGKKLSDQSSICLLASENKKPVGAVRLDKKDDSYEVDIFIDPNRHGEGIGTNVLGLLIKYAKEHGIKKLLAKIKKENIKSIAIFKKNGFVETKENIYECDIS